MVYLFDCIMKYLRNQYPEISQGLFMEKAWRQKRHAPEAGVKCAPTPIKQLYAKL